MNLADLFRRAKQRLIQHRVIDEKTGCWLWNGMRGRRYGHTHVGKDMQFDVHRLAYMLFIGPIPEGKSVLHRCDTPPCFNPDHLFTGTQHDNLTDMAVKGRHHNTLRTVCKFGHPLDGTAVRPRSRRGFQRYCRTCDTNRKEKVCQPLVQL